MHDFIDPVKHCVLYREKMNCQHWRRSAAIFFREAARDLAFVLQLLKMCRGGDLHPSIKVTMGLPLARKVAQNEWSAGFVAAYGCWENAPCPRLTG